ncbi:NEW3 domain-containing protein, partial [Nonomuraea sp. NPDC001023]|uniref:COG1470 family protein n=1 Tax=Nonomuraea sp. NPDC001023 TaxID=3154770 RepID=UPI00331697F6
LGERALGVAEVVVPGPDDAAGVRDLLVALVRAGVTATTAGADWSRYGWLDVDSNLPDFRVMVGGPRENDAVRELLERAGPAYAEVLERDGRVWVPAARPLREVWRPNADLRDLRALPALVTTDPAALTADLADARVISACPGDVPESELLTGHTVALLTYGLPGFAVDPAGTLHLSLMRSCTGWPSGVWIDPPRRTLPDGAGFQLMHWTHEFRYALVSGEGDWRTLTLPARGQEFNHPLYAVIAEPHGGPLPPTRSYLKVEPAREVLVGTLKPTGNPTAHGSAAAADPAAGVTVRLMESTGLGRDAVLSGALTLRETHRADLLERRRGPVEGAVALTGAEVATVIGLPSLPTGPALPPKGSARGGAVLGPAGGSPRGGAVLGPVAEAAQPVHARYWLHNRGPAPMGYLPVSVTASPGLVRTGGEPAELSVVLSSHLLDADVEGAVEILVPDGWTAGVTRRPYRLAAGGHVRFPVTVTPPPGVGPGLYFVAARIRHDGQTVEDVVTVAVGDLPGVLPVPGEIPEEWVAAQGSKDRPGRDTGLSVEVTTPSVRVAPGGRAVLGLALHNRTNGEIRGELQVVSPWGTWDLIAAPVRGFVLAAGERTVAEFEVSAPRDAASGSAWALGKVMWFGRCQYAPTVELLVTP